MDIAKPIAGRKTLGVIRGAAASEPLAPDSPGADGLDLSYAGARATADVQAAAGVDPRRIRDDSAEPPADDVAELKPGAENG